MDAKYKKMNNDELLEEFKKEYIRLGEPKYKDFNKKRKSGFPTPLTLEKRFGKSWNIILEECGFKLRKIKGKDKEYFKNKLLKLSEQLGKTPTIPEITENLCGISTILTAFKLSTYNEVLEEIGLDINGINKRDITKDDIKEYYLDISNKLGYPAGVKELGVWSNYVARMFGSFAELRKELEIKDKYRSKEEKFNKKYVEDTLIKLYKKYNRSLRAKELKEEIKENKYCNINTIFAKMCTQNTEEAFKRALEYNYFRNNKYCTEKIIELYNDNITVKEIALLVNTTRTTIYKILKDNNISRDRKENTRKKTNKALEMYRDGISLKEIDNILYEGQRHATGVIYKRVKSNRYNKNN